MMKNKNPNLFDTNEEPKVSKRYLIQIHRIKLQDYIQHALIAPDSYFDDEIEKDIQSKNPNFLVVSDGYLQDLDEHQILVELILTDEEIVKLHRVGEVGYFDFPLPITRIKKVYAQDKDVAKHILINIHNNEKGFLPEGLMDVYLDNGTPKFPMREYSPISTKTGPSGYQEHIINYDKRMGMFAFMKNANLYYHETTWHIANYSDNYFAALSYYLENKLVESGGFLQLKDVFDRYADFKTLLYSNRQIDEIFLEKIAEKIDDPEIKEVFAELFKENSVRKTLPLLFEKDLGLYLIGLVYYFRKKDANKKDNFKIEIEKLIPYEVAEVSLAILGIYLGYTLIRPIETIEIKDEVFQQIFGSAFNMKFRLDSKLDYITIESIYNYCFNDKQKGYEFEYLVYPKNQKGLSIPHDQKFDRGYEVITQEMFYGSVYIKLKKLSFGEMSQKRLQSYPDKVELGKHHVYSYFAKYFPIQNDPKTMYSKDEFLEILKEITPEQYRELTCLFEADGK